MSERAKLTGYPDHKTVQMAIILENAAGHDTTADILSILRERLAKADATVAALTAENERLTREITNACDTAMRLDIPTRELVGRLRAALPSTRDTTDEAERS